MIVFIILSVIALSVPAYYISYRRSGNLLLPYLAAVRLLLAAFLASSTLDGGLASVLRDISVACAGVLLLLASSRLDSRFALAVETDGH